MDKQRMLHLLSLWANRAKILFALLGIISAVTYVTSYYALSRSAYEYADSMNLEGFYFVFPSDSHHSLVNSLLTNMYTPMVYLDYLSGSGRWPGKEPLMDIARLPPDEK